MREDILYALRTLRKRPLFTIVAVLTLALGFGANTAIFSVIDAVILRPLPFRDADSLVAIWEKNPALGGFISERMPGSFKNYSEWKAQSHSFESMGAFQDASLNLTGFDKPEQLDAAVATPSLFSVLGVSPAMGRNFTPAETSSGQNQVAILSHDFYQRRFAGARNVLGRALTLSGSSYTVIGVLPASFHLPALWEGLDEKNVEIWLPMNEHPSEAEATDRGKFVFARMKPGVSLDQARAEMNVIGARLQKRYPEMNSDFGVNVFPLVREDVGPEMHRSAVILQIAVGFVLLIACANVANLLLTRAAAREKEIAIRMALGAGRLRIVRQVLVESLLLALLGGGTGMLIGVWIIHAIGSLAPEDLYHLHDLHLNVTVLVLTFLMVLVSALLFGLAPAWYAAGQNVNESLAKGGRAGSAGVSSRLRNALVISEVAFAALLLVGSALMLRSLAAMLGVGLGFQTDHVLTMHVRLPESKYKTPEQVKAFDDQLLARIQTVPGVQSAAIATGLPMLDNISINGFEVEGRPANPKDTPVTDVKRVSETYFDALRMPILRGRGFTRQEAEAEPATVTIVNDSLAHRISPDGNAIGKTVLLNDRRQRVTVVGIEASVHQMGLDTESRPELLLPSRRISSISVMARTAGDPARLASTLTEQVWAIDKDQPVSEIKTLDQRTAEGNARRRFEAFLFASFAGLALILAGVGLYGVLSYAVAQRTREIGIRVALGADRGHVARLIVGNGFTLVGLGLAIGLLGAFALTRLMSSLLFGISSSDPLSYVGAVLLLAPTALLACYIPARRAARIDPMVSLRVE